MQIAVEGTNVVLTRGNQLRVVLTLEESEWLLTPAVLAAAVKQAQEYKTDAGLTKRIAEAQAVLNDLVRQQREARERVAQSEKEEKKRQAAQ